VVDAQTYEVGVQHCYHSQYLNLEVISNFCLHNILVERKICLCNIFVNVNNYIVAVRKFSLHFSKDSNN